MKKNRVKFLIIELFLLMLAVFFVWKIFDQNVAETRIAVILPESGDKRWDALIKGMKQFAAENNVHMIICNTDEIDGPEAQREFIKEQKDNDIDGFILYPAPGRETENMLKKECGFADGRQPGGKRGRSCQSCDPAGLSGDRKKSGRTAENERAKDWNYCRLEDV